MRRPPMKRSRGRESRLKRDCLGQKTAPPTPGGISVDDAIG